MNILVTIEQRNGELKKASLEALSLGKKLAGTSGGRVAAVLVGSSIAALTDKVKEYGAEKIFTLEKEDLAFYQSEAHMAAAVKAAEEFNAQCILIASTAMGRDLAPRIAAKMNIMYLPDTTDLQLDGDNLIAHRPVYAGKAYVDIKAIALPVVVATRPNVFEMNSSPGTGEIVPLSVEYSFLSKVVDVAATGGEKLDVAEADRIVAGGRGMKDAENFKMLEELANTLGAAVGASRAVVDADWRPHSEQIGQTGKTVGPTLYIAAGISGAVQHLAGMTTSKVIVAINKDPDAPIFKVADYGIVGDALEIIPKLTEELK